jgi:hypothetical protein
MRWNRAKMSWMETKIACPMWRLPVTFGGGIATTKGALPLSATGANMPPPRAASAAEGAAPRSHHADTADSTAAES